MKKSIIYMISSLLAICLVWVSYFVEREQFIFFFILYFFSFAAFLVLYQSFRKNDSLKFGIQLSLILRVLLLFVIPNLSNDFYRFIWDGRMSVLGFNPFTVLPNDFIGTENMAMVGKDAQKLYDGQGSLSPGNYTCYPPVNQVFFIIPAFLFPQNIFFSIVLMRLMIIGAEIGTIHFGRKILRKLNLPESNILLYALNPFVIIELTGNLHFEAVTVFFLVVAVYYLLSEKWLPSALFMTLSVSVKLIPLIFLPVFLKRLGQNRTLKYSLFVILGSIILFLPFFSQELGSNFMSSIDLYFRKFEFNASIYYIIRWIGYQTHGWNIIQKAGPLLGIVVFVVVLLLSIIPKNQNPKQLMVSMLFAVSIYYFFSTTVHPWYLAVPLILSVFTRYRFMIVWSLLVMLSYNAYQFDDFQENLWFNMVEYGLVFGFLIGEALSKNSVQFKSTKLI
ncbi:MAG: hypothetical protein R2750_09460 [Bacteroidales bacterium]